jgi:hypothetical protein
MEWRYGTKTKEILEAVPEGSENAVNALYLSALFGQDVTPHLANLYKQGKHRTKSINTISSFFYINNGGWRASGFCVRQSFPLR